QWRSRSGSPAAPTTLLLSPRRRSSLPPMLRRAGRVLLAFVVFDTTGCAVLDIVMLPIRLVLSLLGAIGGAIGIADAVPERGPPPVVSRVGEERWAVDGLRSDAPCTIVCSAPGFETRTFAWPADFDDVRGEVAVRLERAK